MLLLFQAKNRHKKLYTLEQHTLAGAEHKLRLSYRSCGLLAFDRNSNSQRFMLLPISPLYDFSIRELCKCRSIPGERGTGDLVSKN